MRCAFDMVSACASVLATTKSTPSSPAVIMLLTALPPAPPTPNTVIRGRSSRMSGTFRLMVMVASRLRPRVGSPRPTAAVIDEGRMGAEKVIRSPREAIVRPFRITGSRSGAAALPRFDVFEVSVLRIDQEAGRHRERGALGLVGQPAEASGRPTRTGRPRIRVASSNVRSAAMRRRSEPPAPAALPRTANPPAGPSPSQISPPPDAG